MDNHQLNLTNLDKIFWPEDGYTKGDVINYYETIAHYILPHLKNRPMVLNRHPHGIAGESFFQKQIDVAHSPTWIETVNVKHAKKSITYLVVQDVNTLLYVANLGCIELNPFHAQRANLAHPDYTVIDLDPENVSFDLVIEAALTIHDFLNESKINNYCKTSGGRGLHIYIPLGGKYTYQESQYFAHVIGLIAQTKMPNLISLEYKPSNRQKRIYVDFLRNRPGQTLASAYCIRPRAHAPVSTPLLWNEVKTGVNTLDFTIKTVPKRLKNVGDIFSGVLGKGINLTKCLNSLQKNITKLS